MHRFSLRRRVVLYTGVVVFIFTSLTTIFQSSSSSTTSGFLVPEPAPANNIACQIWPGWQGSNPERLLYEDCAGTTESPLVGDINVLGNSRRCLLPSSRFDQYRSSPGLNWTEVSWGQVQKRCASRASKPSLLEDQSQRIWRGPVDSQLTESASEGNRVAVVLRAYDNYDYTENRLAWLRALIAEISLQRDGAYQVFFLVNVKDPNIRLEEDDAAYQQALTNYVPEEFRDMAVLYNERTLKAWYPQVQEHGAQDQMYQALQIFSQKFQQFDYIWQLEMDLRFTGHIHDTLESATTFARSQGRRNLWERNGRFYVPELHGNSYEKFSDAVDAEFGDTGIWGPVITADFVPRGPEPPPRTKRDWGVGEDADLISFMPMIDPVGTNWVYEDYVTGFEEGLETPRRVAIISVTRSSRRLLKLVSDAQQKWGQWVVSEATLETFALLHGLKAVSVPHPISFANEMGAEQLDAEVNPGPAHSKAGGWMPTLFYSKQGWLLGAWWQASYWFSGDSPANFWKAYMGGRRLPSMLIHPVKET